LCGWRLLVLAWDDRSPLGLIFHQVGRLQLFVVALVERMLALDVSLHLFRVGDFRAADFAFHGISLPCEELKRSNLAARAPHLENAHFIAATGLEFVLHVEEAA
jgi:hypothetical protein